MSAVHKQIAHILPEGNEFGNQPLFYVPKLISVFIIGFKDMDCAS